ncbi:MAG: hypothetical protein U1F67_08915 [Rubrivivax sp.]
MSEGPAENATPLRQAAANEGSGVAVFDEDTARAVPREGLRDRAADEALWSRRDAAWASRLADETTTARLAQPARRLARSARANHALRRIVPRRAALARAFERRRWSGRWVVLAALVAAVLGAAGNLVGASQVIDLLAAPLWVVVAWNALVYAWLAVAALRRSGAAAKGDAPASAGPLRRTAQRWIGTLARPSPRSARARRRQRFAIAWARAAAPLATWRAAWLLHVAALALALGAAGRDVRPRPRARLPRRLAEHAARTRAGAHAARDAARAGRRGERHRRAGRRCGGAVAHRAWRRAARACGRRCRGGARQRVPWLHLFAFTVALAVLVPRSLPALHAAWRSWRASRHCRWRSTTRTPRSCCSAAAARRPPAVQVLARLLSFATGDAGAAFAAGGAVRSGARTARRACGRVRRRRPARAGAAARHRLAHRLVRPRRDARPQAQGAFVAGLRAASPPLPLVLLVDEAAYRQRMGAASPRAWPNAAAPGRTSPAKRASRSPAWTSPKPRWTRLRDRRGRA